MTPQPARVPYRFQPVGDRESPQTTVKAELMKYALAVVVAALTSYFATIYAIKEEVALLKVHLEYLRRDVAAQTEAIRNLTATIDAHTRAHEQAPPPRRGRP